MSSIGAWSDWRAAADGAAPNRLAELIKDLASVYDRHAWAELPALAHEAAVWTLVEPDAAAGLASAADTLTAIAQRLEMPRDADAILAVLDLLNIVTCVSGQLPEARYLASLIPELAAIAKGWTVTRRLRLGCAGLRYEQYSAFHAIVDPGFVYDGKRAQLPPSEILPHLWTAACNGIRDPIAWWYLLAHVDELLAQDVVDAETLIWLARLLFESRVGTGEIARTLARDIAQLDRAAEIIDDKRRMYVGYPHKSRDELPFTATINNGAYRIDDHLLGERRWRLYRGHVIADPSQRCLVSCLTESGTPKLPLARLRDELAYAIPGVFDLAYLGPLDLPQDRSLHIDAAKWCVLVERLPPGDAASRLITGSIGPAEAVRLGVSVGRIVERAQQEGVLLTALRPDYIWLKRDAGGHLRTSGLTARNERFFASHTWGEFPSISPFVRPYGAPDRVPSDRSLVFTLAVMIAEWTTGQFPFPGARDCALHRIQISVDHPYDPDLGGVPAVLVPTLLRGLCPDAAQRPGLSAWLHELKGVRV